MNTSPPKKLSSGLLEDIRMNWLGDTSASAAHADRRIRACQGAAVTMASDMKRQLGKRHLGRLDPQEGHRELVLGYANGMSEALLRESGESSRWAVELISLSALLELWGEDWDEDTLFGQGQRLWCQKHPCYIAGIRAAESDRQTFCDGRRPDGLATCVANLPARLVPDSDQGWLPFL